MKSIRSNNRNSQTELESRDLLIGLKNLIWNDWQIQKRIEENPHEKNVIWDWISYQVELYSKSDRKLTTQTVYYDRRKGKEKSYKIPGLRDRIISSIDDYLKGRESEKYITRKEFKELERVHERTVRRIFNAPVAKGGFGGAPAITKEEYRQYKQNVESGNIIRRPHKKARKKARK